MNSINILVPDLPKSVANATIAIWHKKPDDAVIRDEVLMEIETDKVVLEVPASADGILDAILESEGTTVMSRQIFGRLRKGNSAGKEASVKSEGRASTPAQRQQASLEEQNNDTLSPVIHHLPAEHNLDASAIRGTDVGGRLTREDVEKHLAKAPAKESAPVAPAPATQPALAARGEKHVPIARLRKYVAERLLGAKNSTAILTTFSEVSMKPIMDLRKQYDEASEKHRGIRLGFMSFYVKAVVKALRCYPEVNASIDSNDVIYCDYFDVSMTVSTPYGLVTPVLHGADALGMADIEKKIKELAVKGHDGKLTVEDLTGGSFTITNDGMFGSLVSTPIINPPQSAILGIHAIKDRPTAVNGQIEILPMIYLALLYDYRLVDGRESMDFLATIKGLLEDPACLLLDV